MKKFFNIIGILIIFILVVTGCGNNAANSGNSTTAEKNSADGKFTIVTSFYPMYVFTKNITDGIDGVEVINMTEVNTGCLHDYQLLPDDMKTLENADAFVINGAGMESFMNDVISRLPNLNIIEASVGVELLCIDGHTHEHSKDGEHHNEEYNSHVWLSPLNAIIEVENIAEKLAELDPENSEKYKTNSENYINSLKVVDNELAEILKPFEGKNIITSHEAFGYMAERYNFNIVGNIQTGHNQAISAAQMAELTEIAKEKDVTAIVAEEQYESGIIDALSIESGVSVVELNAMVSGGEDYKNIYRDIMLGNAKALINS